MPLLFELLPDESRGKVYMAMSNDGRAELRRLLEEKQEPTTWEQPAVDLDEIEREMKRPPDHQRRVT